VALFEQFAIGHDRGSSHGTARIFRRAYPDEYYVRLTGEAGDWWRELESDTGAPLLRTTGGLDHGARRSPQVIAALLAAAGVPHALLDPREAGCRWPGMRFATPVLFHPEAGVIDADATVRACVALSRRRGALVFEHTPVLAVVPGATGVTVRAATATIRAAAAVVAAGAWVPDVAHQITGFPTVTVSQQQIFHFPRRDPSVDWPVFVHKEDGLSTFGLPGGGDGGPANAQKVAEHGGGRVTTAASRDGIVDPAARSRVTAYVREWLPGLLPEPFNETTCLYTTTADEDFVLDRRGAIVVCSACSGHGAKFAPWLGVQAARLAAGEGPGPARFRLDRPTLTG
jgi:glycine/D-amino acid oxidase-like deaminating enzyme